MEKSREILETYWGFTFRPLQEEIVDNAIYGHDTLAILPTGGGKSICFQVPGIAREGVTIVISPLIALMQDQVSNLEKRGIRAIMLSASMSYKEIDIELDNARFGKTKFIYLSPERLQSSLFLERFKLMNVALIVIDEAHCISEWGQDFRPSYAEISKLREYHPEVPFLAVTASATPEVKSDIIERLQLKSPKIIEGSVERTNLSYAVINRENKLKAIEDYILQHKDSSGIVYCQTRRSVKEVALALRSRNISAGIYHGGMQPSDRTLMLNEWLNNNLKVIVATNAFGMGIDKPDVRYVLHYEFPNNLEAYYQEAGRAGRDGLDASATIFYNELDEQKHINQLEIKYPEIDVIKSVYDAIGNYLQIAIGSGKDENYTFDILDFCKRFNLSSASVYSAIKILTANGNLSFEEESFLPTRLKMTIGQSALYKFQVAHPELNTLILPLLRSYPGIFDRFVRIDEMKLAEIAKITKSKLRQHFQFMEQQGVIEIQFQNDKPQLFFTRERIAISELKIQSAVYITRREKDQFRLDQIRDYIHSAQCRSALISAYFGSEVRNCGKCDNCIKGSRNIEPNKLIDQITQVLPATEVELMNKLTINRNELNKILHTLLLEEVIEIKNGMYVKI